MAKCKKKYIKITAEGTTKKGVCKVMCVDAEGRNVECGKVYSNPSPTTRNDHLCGHIHLEECVGNKLTQRKLDDFSSSKGLKDFKNLAVSLLVNNNLPCNLYESSEWKFLLSNHLMRDNFGAHAAKAHLEKLVTTGKDVLTKVLAGLSSFSISEDEGSVNSDPKVLHNLHYVDVDDLSIKTVFFTILYHDKQGRGYTCWTLESNLFGLEIRQKEMCRFLK